LLIRLFTTEDISSEYNKEGGIRRVIGYKTFSEKRHDLNLEISGKINKLDSIYNRLDLYSVTQSSQSTEVIEHSISKPTANKNRDVFVVHGHDENAKLSLENFLREHGFNPIVLQKTPIKGAQLFRNLRIIRSRVCFHNFHPR